MSTRRTPVRPETWAGFVLGLLKEHKKPITLSELYELVRQRGRKRLRHNRTYQATVRRTVQDLRDMGLAVRISDGVWQYRAGEDTASATTRKRSS